MAFLSQTELHSELVARSVQLQLSYSRWFTYKGNDYHVDSVRLLTGNPGDDVWYVCYNNTKGNPFVREFTQFKEKFTQIEPQHNTGGGLGI